MIRAALLVATAAFACAESALSGVWIVSGNGNLPE